MHTSSIMIETDIYTHCTRTTMQTNIGQVVKAIEKVSEIKGIRRGKACDRDEINSFAYKCFAIVTIVKKTGRNFLVAFRELVYM